MKSGARFTNGLMAIAVMGLTTVGVLGIYLLDIQRQAIAYSEDADPRGGTVILCGGASIPGEVFGRFIRQAGGSSSRIAVVAAYHPTAKEEREIIAEWKRHGAHSVVVLKANTRGEAEEAAELLDDVTGIWISGGNQRLLSDIYVDTAVETKIKELLDRDGVVGGVSAGAAAMTQTMIVGGSSDLTLENRGFDLLPGVVVDQHFLHRNRTSRLLKVLANHPELIGLGIDEHTAVVVDRAPGRWTVIGKSYAMVFLPEDAGFPRLEILKAGDSTQIDSLRDEPGEIAINSSDFWNRLGTPRN